MEAKSGSLQHGICSSPLLPLFLQPLSKALHENTKYHDDRRIPPTDGSWRAEVWEEEANRGLSVFWHLLTSSTIKSLLHLDFEAIITAAKAE